MSGRKRRGSAPNAPRSVPDVLAPGLRVVFCGINPGFVSAEAGAHFANPRNDFWRLLHDAGFTPRLYAPEEQFSVLELGIGLTNAAIKTTRGSSDLRRADFAGSHERLLELALEYHPRAIAFVGKEAFRGAFGRRAEHGPQEETLDDVGTYVLPSTSPANAAVPYAERLKWFSALNEWLEPVDRPAVRALVVDGEGRALLVQFRDVTGQTWWANPGGGIEEGEDVEAALRRELAEEIGLTEFELGPEVWTARAHVRLGGPHHPPARARLARPRLRARAEAEHGPERGARRGDPLVDARRARGDLRGARAEAAPGAATRDSGERPAEQAVRRGRLDSYRWRGER